jgi:hypothetical protein
MSEKLSERMSDYAARFTGDGQEPDLISAWANEVAVLEKHLDEAVIWHEGDDSPHSRLEAQLASLQAQIAVLEKRLEEAVHWMPGPVDSFDADKETFEGHSVSLVIVPKSAAHAKEKDHEITGGNEMHR